MPLDLLLGAVRFASTCRAPAQGAVDPVVGWRMVSFDLDLEFEPAGGKMQGRGTAVLELENESSFGPTVGMNARAALMRFTSVEAQPPADVRINETFPALPNARVALVRYPQALAKSAPVTLAFVWESKRPDAQFAVTDGAAIASWTEGWYPVPAPSPEIGRASCRERV